MWRIVLGAAVLLAPLPAVRAQEKKPDTGQDLKVAGKLSADDPKDKKLTNSPHKVHEFQMKAGGSYIIDLRSQQFDSYLRLEDSEGNQLAEDDDGGGFPNSRITIKTTKDDKYRIIVTSFDGKSGAYALTVKMATEAYAKLNAIKSEFKAGMMKVQQGAMVGKDFDMEKYYSGIGELHAKFVDRYQKFAADNAEDVTSAGEAKALMRQMIAGMGNSPAPMVGVKLRAIISKSSEKDLLGPANFALGQHLAKRYQAAFQKKDADAAKLSKEAETVLEQTAKDYPVMAAQVKEALFDFTKLSVGRKAMEIEGEDIDGKQFKLSDYRGKVVVIDFWGHW